MPTIILSLLGKYWPYAGLIALALLCWHFDARAVANADALRTQAAQYRQAQADAATTARQAVLSVQAQYAAKAQEADNAQKDALADAQSAADRYITDHSVCPATAASNAGGARTAAENSDPGLHESLPAGSVVVSTDDVHACTAAVDYAQHARDYLLSIATASPPTGTPTDGH